MAVKLEKKMKVFLVTSTRVAGKVEPAGKTLTLSASDGRLLCGYKKAVDVADEDALAEAKEAYADSKKEADKTDKK